MVNPGWLTVYGKEAETDDTPTLAPVKPDETVKTSDVEVKANVTKPPPRYTEATLLSAMEGAGKLVEDDELREAMREKGLGTPATRAAIIEGLIYENYIHRNGRELQATAKAFSLMELLNGLGIPELTKPELTGDWEFKLHQIQRRQKSRDEFMSEIADMTRHIVERAKKFEDDTIPGDFGVLKTPCPKCGGEVHEKYKQFQCVRKVRLLRSGKRCAAGCSRSRRWRSSSRTNRSGRCKDFRSKKGMSVRRRAEADAGVQDGIRFRQRTAEGNGEAAAPVDFTGKEPLGKCPKCGARVFDAGMNYLCEKATGPDKTCTFRTGKIILQQEISPAQVKKLLAEGKTDLLTKVHLQEKRTARSRRSWWSRMAARRLNFRRASERRRAKDGGAEGTAAED